MDQDTKDRIAVNLSLLPKRASVYAYAIGTALLTAYTGASEEQRLAAYALLHIPPVWYPAIAFVVGLALQVWPQQATAPAAVQAKLDEKVAARTGATQPPQPDTDWSKIPVVGGPPPDAKP